MKKTCFLVLAVSFSIINFAQTQPFKSNAQRSKFSPLVDHHQHVFSPAYAALQSAEFKTVSAQDVINMLDKAGIKRGVLLSTAFRWGRPDREPPNEYEGVKKENDWTAAQASLFPKRLIAFAAFNPVKDYAIEELERCAKIPNLSHGIKLHFGNSDVQMENPEHFSKLKKVFQQANNHRMAIVVHMRASMSKQRPYGPQQALLFLELLSYAPDIPVQIAHLASSGPGYVDSAAHTVIQELANAVSKKDFRTRNLWFDVASNVHPENQKEVSQFLVKMIRQIGIKRILYGTDGAAGNNLRPQESWDAFTKSGLTKKEIKRIAKNIAPYMH